MELKLTKTLNLFERWSYVVPILCYLAFFSMIWILSLPLKSNTNLEISDDENFYSKEKLEDTFEIRIKNSNFNSDKEVAENELLNTKTEYLVNFNSYRNKYGTDQTKILEEVFTK